MNLADNIGGYAPGQPIPEQLFLHIFSQRIKFVSFYVKAPKLTATSFVKAPNFSLLMGMCLDDPFLSSYFCYLSNYMQHLFPFLCLRVSILSMVANTKRNRWMKFFYIWKRQQNSNFRYNYSLGFYCTSAHYIHELVKCREYNNCAMGLQNQSFELELHNAEGLKAFWLTVEEQRRIVRMHACGYSEKQGKETGKTWMFSLPNL